MDNSNGKVWTNDGFGPQLTGKETIVELFENKNLVRSTRADLNARAVRNRLTPELLKKMAGFTKKVNKDTPRFRFLILTDWLEHEVLEMTLKQQVKSKTYSALMKPDAALEESGIRDAILVVSASSVARSSLLSSEWALRSPT